MSLNLKKSLDEGGKYLPEGWHRVRVESYRTFEGKQKGTPGVEYTLRDDEGREGSAGFFITEKAQWRLGKFAKAAGVTDSTLEKFEFDDCIGRSLDVCFEKGDKYVEYKTCDVLGAHTGKKPTPTPVANGARPVAAAVAAGDPLPEDDIPF